MSVEAFEYAIALPSEPLDLESKTLVGFESRYSHIERQLRLISDPVALDAWAKKQYVTVPPIFKRVTEQYPLFLFEVTLVPAKPCSRSVLQIACA